VPAWASARGEDRYGVYADFSVKGVEHRLRWIAPGRFVMGSPEGEAGRTGDEDPDRSERAHEVLLTRGYWLGETPVTQALWEAVMGKNPSRRKDADRPVERVNWNRAKAFVKCLNALAPGLDARLPTEAEWEHACRAGTTTATWAGGLTINENGDAKELDAIAWYHGNSGKMTHAVREKAANPWGLHDMLGNVWEWCSDWRAPYDTKPAVDPLGAGAGTARVLRGGSWNDGAWLVRAANRLSLVPRGTLENIGFRLARGQSATPAASVSKGTTGGRRRKP